MQPPRYLTAILSPSDLCQQRPTCAYRIRNRKYHIYLYAILLDSGGNHKPGAQRSPGGEGGGGGAGGGEGVGEEDDGAGGEGRCKVEMVLVRPTTMMAVVVEIEKDVDCPSGMVNGDSGDGGRSGPGRIEVMRK